MSLQIHRAAVFTLAIAAGSALAQPVINVGPGETIANGTLLPTGATVNVSDGGTIGLAVDLGGGELNIMGGNVALGATGIPSGFTNSGNTVSISGGNVGPFFQFFNSDGVISGGTMNTFGVFSGSTVDVNGGTVTGFPDVFGGGVVNLRGGDVNTFRALGGSRVNIYGISFTLNGSGVPIEVGETMTINARNQPFAAVLDDGSAFTHGLRSPDPGFPTPDVAVSSSTITITRTRCTTADIVAPLGVVNIFDVLGYLDLFTANDPVADVDGNGDINIFDVLAYLDTFTLGCP